MPDRPRTIRRLSTHHSDHLNQHHHHHLNHPHSITNHSSSPNPYTLAVGSPLTNPSYPSSIPSPPSDNIIESSDDHHHHHHHHSSLPLPTSSPTSHRSSLQPFSDSMESDPDPPSGEYETMMLINDLIEEDQQNLSSTKIVNLDNPGITWLPKSTTDRQDNGNSSDSNRHLIKFQNNQPHQNFRSRQFKQSPLTSTNSSSRRSNYSSPLSRRGDQTPFSSPTPISRHANATNSTNIRRMYNHLDQQEDDDDGEGGGFNSDKHNRLRIKRLELRQKESNRIRNLERENRRNLSRPLLETFALGTQKGFNDNLDQNQERLLDSFTKRHIRHLNLQWADLLSSQDLKTDELIQEDQDIENDKMEEDEIMEEEYDLEGMNYDDKLIEELGGGGEELDDSIMSTNSTIRPCRSSSSNNDNNLMNRKGNNQDWIQMNQVSNEPEQSSSSSRILKRELSLRSILLDPQSNCPICFNNHQNQNSLNLIQPPNVLNHNVDGGHDGGIICSKCNWFLDHSKLNSIDQYFLKHGDRKDHIPMIGHNQYFGVHFTCSNRNCDELICI